MYTIYFILFFIACSFICALIETIVDYNNETWWVFNRHKNFPFKWHGKTLWYSRSVAVTLFTYCKNSEGEWCVLANKRGKGTPDYQGYWNCPCGYLDFNENSCQGARRECKEETGIDIPLNKIQVVEVNSDPTQNRQNVSIRHTAILDGTTKDWSNFSKEFMEEGEVEDITWIPLSRIKEYDWAFEHDVLIDKFFKNN